MEDKRLRDKMQKISNQDLRFTQEDRQKVFEQIRRLEKKHRVQKKSLVPFSKKIVPVLISLLVLGLCLVLFMPSMLPKSFHEDGNNSATVVQEDQIVTTLITVKAEQEDDRIPLNLLLTYSKEKNAMKVLSIPRETYAPIANNDGTTVYDKLLFAYAFGSGGAENVRTTVSNLFNLPIDYYAVIDLETFSAWIASINGIDYDLQEDTRVRAITKVGLDFKKGTNRLNGEEVVALMMAATDGRNLKEENLLNLIQIVVNKTKNEMAQAKLKELSTQIEANIPLEQLFENNINLHSIKSVSLSAGIRDDMIDGKYYITFEKDFLTAISEELKTFE
ncbi:LCP family protein [Lysinibacillus sp. C5.1]|uniref:LCP family protein n=1 Tax=Lysinibacillus sp. C5.1 TaxID=2796169 RepID=UPI0030815A93